MQTKSVNAPAVLETPAVVRPSVAQQYQWVMLALATLCVIATFPGQTTGVSTFNEPIREALFLSHSQFASAYMLGTLLGALPLAYLGALVDRHGLKSGLLAGLLALSAACIIAANAQGWLALFAAFLLLRMLGPGLISLLSANTLAYWFDRRLGIAEGLRQLGFAIAIAFMPKLNLVLIDHVGWRGAWVIFGAVLALGVVPVVALFFRNRSIEDGPTDGTEVRPHSYQTGLTCAEARKTSAYWGILLMSMWWGLLGTAIAFNAVPLVKDRGLTEADGALLLQAFALSLAVMHVVAGTLVDRIPPQWLLTAAMLSMGVSTGMLTFVESSWMVAISGIGMGISQACSTGLGSVLCARYFGRAYLGSIRGSIASATVACSSLGPLFFGMMYDHFGGYQLVLWICTVVSLAGIGLIALIRKPQAAVPAE